MNSKAEAWKPVKSRILQKKLRHGHRIFVYTINKKSNLQRLSEKYDVAGFYTDFLNFKSSHYRHN